MICCLGLQSRLQQYSDEMISLYVLYIQQHTMSPVPY